MENSIMEVLARRIPISVSKLSLADFLSKRDRFLCGKNVHAPKNFNLSILNVIKCGILNKRAILPIHLSAYSLPPDR